MVDQQKCGLYLIGFTNVFDGPYIIGINFLGQVISPITQGLKFEIPYVKANFFFFDFLSQFRALVNFFNFFDSSGSTNSCLKS